MLGDDKDVISTGDIGGHVHLTAHNLALVHSDFGLIRSPKSLYVVSSYSPAVVIEMGESVS